MKRAPAGRWLVLTAVVLATAVLWLALGIREGLEAEIRSLVNRIGANLFYVHANEGFGNGDLTRLANLAEIAAVAGEGGYSTAYIPGQTYNLTYLKVSPDYLKVFQLPLASGRSFTPDDEDVVILGWKVKEVVFGNINPVGRLLDGKEIIGVLAPIPDDDEIRRRLNDWVLVPAGSDEKLYWTLLVRIGGAAKHARQAIMHAFPRVTITPISKRYSMYFATERTLNSLLVMSSLGMFIIAGAMVAGLLLLSVIDRSWEIGVRRTVGATAPDIMRLFVAEGLFLVGAGGIIGSGLGQAMFFLFSRLGSSPRLGEPHAVVFPLVFIVGLIASVYPSWQAARMNPAYALSLRTLEARSRSGIGGGRFIAMFVVAIASGGLFLLISLVAGSQQFLGSLWGPIDERTLLVQSPRQSILAPPELSVNDLRLLRTLPGVEVVAVCGSRSIRINGINSPAITVKGVANGWANLKLLNVEQGRDLSEQEIGKGKPVALLAASFAQNMFGGQNPIGQTLSIKDAPYKVVGVFNDRMSMWVLGAQVIIPYKCLEGLWFSHSFFVHTAPEAQPDKLRTAIVDLFQDIYPNTAKVEVITPAAQVTEWRRFLVAAASRLSILVGLGLLLGAIGVFNLVSFLLLLRTRELGIRRVAGATKYRIVTLGVMEALKITVPAGFIGLGLSIAGTGPMQRFLNQPSSIPLEWAWIIIVAVICIGVVAGGWPAWRTSQLSPAKAIRRGNQ